MQVEKNTDYIEIWLFPPTAAIGLLQKAIRGEQIIEDGILGVERSAEILENALFGLL